MLNADTSSVTTLSEDIKHMGTDASTAVPGPTKLPFPIARILMMYLDIDTLNCPFVVKEPV